MIKRKFSIVMATALALVIMAFSGSAFAQNYSTMETGALENLGDTILFSYYDIRTAAQGGPGLSDNYFTVVNTDDNEYTQVHVRVRTGQCSVELLDFDAILSPLDVFTFDIYQGSTGNTVFASCDTKTLIASGFNVDTNGCFVLDTATFPAALSLIETCGNCPSGTAITSAEALAATRYGYVEVIGEAEMEPVTGVNCSGAGPNTPGCTICTEAQLIAGEYTAWEWFWEDECGDLSNAEVDADLFGRVYYAKFDASRNIVELATSNGVSLGNAVNGYDYDVIIHRPCYSDTSPGCVPGDGELENTNYYVSGNAKFAYNKAYESDQSALPGAPDMNYCFWTRELGDDSANDVVNRVGAAATFGPTLADLRNGYASYRTGDAITTEYIIADLNDRIAKEWAVSHYFYLPGRGQTKYVFTFPFQHFINETITISPYYRLDTEENACAIPTGKFISPGLPSPTSPRGEVTIIETQQPNDPCTFNEGWVAYELAITQVGPSLDEWNFTYPGVIGVVTNSSDGSSADSVLSTAPMQWWEE